MSVLKPDWHRDERPVVSEREMKSISHETTFAANILNRHALRAWAWERTDLVGRRLRRQQLKGRTFQLKVRFADFRTLTHPKTLPPPTDVTQEMGLMAGELLAEALPVRHQGVRLMGVGVSWSPKTTRAADAVLERESPQTATARRGC